MTIQYEKMIVLLFNQLFMFRLQTAKILYDLLHMQKVSISVLILDIII